MSKKRKRIALTLTLVYIDRLARLVSMGFYMERQAAIRQALRRLFEHHGVPLTLEEAEG